MAMKREQRETHRSFSKVKKESVGACQGKVKSGLPYIGLQWRVRLQAPSRLLALQFMLPGVIVPLSILVKFPPLFFSLI